MEDSMEGDYENVYTLPLTSITENEARLVHAGFKIVDEILAIANATL